VVEFSSGALIDEIGTATGNVIDNSAESVNNDKCEHATVGLEEDPLGKSINDLEGLIGYRPASISAVDVNNDKCEHETIGLEEDPLGKSIDDLEG